MAINNNPPYASIITQFNEYKAENSNIVPLQIVDENFALNKQHLESILKCREICDKRVAIVSVCGETRKGKSFLLSLLMIYLKYQKVSYSFGSVHEPILNTDFQWKSGTKSHTFGIWMWPQPFYIEGVDTPILLMDTQGIFGLGSDKINSNKVFALSLLISSIQIYNIFHTLQENNLEILYTFTEYSRQAQQFYLKKKRPFQHLVILLRDWNFTEEHSFGSAGGIELLKNLELAENQSKEAQSVRYQISKCFEKIDGFLLPRPCDKVCNGTISNLIDIDLQFKVYVEMFCKDLFNPTIIKPKEINGNAVTGNEIYEYFVNYFDVLNNENVISPISMIEATTKTTNMLAVSKTMENYKQRMTKNLNLLEGRELLYKHDQTMRLAINEFINLPKFGDPDKINEYMIDLMDQMWSFYDGLNIQLNENNQKAKKEFEKAVSRAFNHYVRFMDGKFDSDHSNVNDIVNFEIFKEADNKYNKEALEVFSEYDDHELVELRLIYQNSLDQKIAKHYKKLNELLKLRNDKIFADYEDKLNSVKVSFTEDINKFLIVDDICTLGNKESLEKYNKLCMDKAHKFFNNIKTFVPDLNEDYYNRFILFANLELERIKRSSEANLATADNICRNIVDEVKQMYVEKMCQFKNVNSIREKHPEVFQICLNAFNKKIDDVNGQLYKNLSIKYIPTIEEEIGRIHNRHMRSGYLSDTFDELYDYQLKILVVGDRGVGKTTLINRFVNNHVLSVKETRDKLDSTPDISARITSVCNTKSFLRFWTEKSVKTAIWDINAVNDSRRLPNSYQTNVDGILIVIDVTNSSTVLGLSEWLKEICALNASTPKFLIANKIDAEERVVTTQIIAKEAALHSLRFKELSALSGSNVDQAFKDFSSSLVSDKYWCVIL